MDTIWEQFVEIQGINDALSEFSKKYKDTLIGITDTNTGTTKYGYFCGMQGSSLIFEGNKETFSVEYTNTNYAPFVPTVEVGSYTSEKLRCLVVFSTLPHRQWKKGLCRANSQVTPVLNTYTNINMISVGPNNRFNETIMEILTNTEAQKTKTLSEGIAYLLAKDITGCSLNRDFGITKNFVDMDENIFFLFNQDYLIGKINEKEKQVFIENELFLQEVLDSHNQLFNSYKVIQV